MGGLGAVLAITPPQLGANDALSISSASVGVSSGTAEVAPASSSSTTVASKSAAPKASAKATAAATKKASSAAKDSAANNSGTAAAATTAPAVSSAKSINGSFTGPAVFVNYGTVQVKITVVNGRITDAVAVQAPSGRNDRWTNMAVPILKEQTLKAQSANIQGASGASYTAYAWWVSLQSALSKAGWM